MYNNPENNFFHITLTQQGASWLLRICKITSLIIILGSIASLLHLTSLGIRLFMFTKLPEYDSWQMIFQVFVAPAFEILVTLITIIQIYYSYKYIRQCKRGIELQHTDLFNESFQPLLKSSVLGLLIFILNIVFFCLLIHWQMLVFVK